MLTKERQRPTLVNRLYAFYLSTIHALYSGLVTSKLVKKYNADVILERETSLGAGAIASFIMGRPLFLEIIGPNYSEISFKKAKKIFTYTRTMIRSKIPDEKLVFITAAADTDKFKPDCDSRLSIRKKFSLENFFVIGYVGTFLDWHGIEEIVVASRIVLKREPNSRFLMVGPYFEKMSNLALQHGVSKFFIFTGSVDYSEVPKYINASDILIAPYNPKKSVLREKYGLGSPLKVFEYMACAKPVITTAVEPITSIIKDGETGLLIPPGDAQSLADTIILLIRDVGKAEMMGKLARKEVESRYSWKILVRKMEMFLK